MLIILDSSIIIPTFLSKKKTYSKDIIRLASRKAIYLAISKETLQELKIAISKDSVKKLASPYTHLIGSFIAWYQFNSTLYSLNQDIEIPDIRDPKDRIYLQLAAASQAEYLISADKDLLQLKIFGKTKIVTPEEFIHSNPSLL